MAVFKSDLIFSNKEGTVGPLVVEDETGRRERPQRACRTQAFLEIMAWSFFSEYYKDTTVFTPALPQSMLSYRVACIVISTRVDPTGRYVARDLVPELDLKA